MSILNTKNAMKTKTLVVAGTRTNTNYALLKRHLRIYKQQIPNLKIVTGCARGTDALARRYAQENNLRLQVYKAEWNKYGRAAGPIRNKEMAATADCALLFWDNKSRGTKSMITELRKIGVQAIKIVHLEKE